MAYSLSPLLKPRFFVNATNKPLVGGKLYTYLAETTTPATTYSNDTGTPNANPIILDANGECNLYLDDDVSYRLILKDANDVTYFDKDRVSSIGGGDYKVLTFNTMADLRLKIGSTKEPSAQTSGYYVAGDGGGNHFYWDGTSSALDNGRTIIKPTFVSGAGRWLALNSAQIMTNAKTAKMMLGAIRNTGSGWAYIEDSAHAPIRFTGTPTIVTAPEDFKLTLTHTTGMTKVGTLVCCPDETFAPYGVVIGASVGTNSSTLRAGMPLRFRTYGATAVADFHPFFGSRVSIAALGDGTGFTATVPQLQNGTATTMPIVGSVHYVDGRATDIQIKSLSLTQFEVRAVCDYDAYIAYNGSVWNITTDNVLTTHTAVWDGVDTLIITHDTTSSANTGVIVSQVYGGYKPLIVTSSSTSVSIKFVNDAGTVQTTPSTAFKFRLHRPHKLPRTMMTTQTCYFDCGMALLYWGDIISANGNIWLMGMMHS